MVEEVHGKREQKTVKGVLEGREKENLQAR